MLISSALQLPIATQESRGKGVEIRNICGNGVKLGVRVSPPCNSTSSVHHPGLIRAEQEQDAKGQNTTKLGI